MGREATMDRIERSREVWTLGERAGFPELVLSQAVTLRAGENNWRRFCAFTRPHLMDRALASLRERSCVV